MTKQASIRAIAVDGGGTQCRIACVTSAGRETVIKGAANAFSDFEGTVQVINTALAELGERLAVPVHQLASAPTYLGLAGVVDSRIAENLRHALPFSTVKIEDDRPASISAALGTADGVVAHCGTGSFFASQQNNVQRFVGGWGPVLDDIASARWMGCRLLSLTLYAYDGLVDKTSLTKHVFTKYKSAAAMVDFANEASPSELGQLAKLVTQFEQQKDTTAMEIITDGAALITDTVLKLGWHNQPICLTGGLAPHYAPYLPADMQPCVVEAIGEPIDGAVELAVAFSQEVNQ